MPLTLRILSSWGMLRMHSISPDLTVAQLLAVLWNPPPLPPLQLDLGFHSSCCCFQKSCVACAGIIIIVIIILFQFSATAGFTL
jgi:hypothetical protein